MGRRTPDHLKALSGNPGKRALQNTGISATGTLQKPSNLGSYASSVWDQILESMPDNFYCAADSHLLAAYCQCAEFHEVAAQRIAEYGAVVDGQYSPWSRILRDQAQRMTMLSKHLGLTPASRAGLPVPARRVTSKFDGLIPS